MSSSKREANGKVVEMVLKPIWRAPKQQIFLLGVIWEFDQAFHDFPEVVDLIGCGGRI